MCTYQEDTRGDSTGKNRQSHDPIEREEVHVFKTVELARHRGFDRVDRRGGK